MQRTRDSGRGEQEFSRELYGFACICLVGWIVAVAVIPPKARRYWSLLQFESQIAARNAELEGQVEKLRQATYSMEADSFYEQAAMRARLGVKQRGEEYLDLEAPPEPRDLGDPVVGEEP